MRPRVHRHLAGQLQELAVEYRELPELPENEDHETARRLMLEAISLAIKHSMRASVFSNRGNRDAEAESWWSFRAAVRKARSYHGCARIFHTYT